MQQEELETFWEVFRNFTKLIDIGGEKLQKLQIDPFMLEMRLPPNL